MAWIAPSEYFGSRSNSPSPNATPDAESRRRDAEARYPALLRQLDELAADPDPDVRRVILRRLFDVLVPDGPLDPVRPRAPPPTPVSENCSDDGPVCGSPTPAPEPCADDGPVCGSSDLFDFGTSRYTSPSRVSSRESPPSRVRIRLSESSLDLLQGFFSSPTANSEAHAANGPDDEDTWSDPWDSDIYVGETSSEGSATLVSSSGMLSPAIDLEELRVFFHRLVDRARARNQHISPVPGPRPLSPGQESIGGFSEDEDAEDSCG